ncbi:hypothetical protein [Solwaraspora sp. WMMA2065]|uniref:hypothetical protein n=1 Tax=Solwaraspora sp. WMMA2065 TaxID=3015166 RepID=UPI00259B25C3|nr:hypothetical protein [Solwaraspora sp. WMMA2065]WJK36709.1 hypothetical protein O7610_10365 [Solwaraspora sp. WMMA2065]
MQETFWLYEWMDEEGITSGSDANRVLASQQLRARFATRIKEEWDKRQVFRPVDKNLDVVMAGRAIDMSAHASCARCGGPEVVLDQVFRSVWHYFDAVIVEGLSPITAGNILNSYDLYPRLAKGELAAHINALIKIRSMGAEDMLIFRQKYVPCSKHWDHHLSETGLDLIESRAGQIISTFEHEGRLESLSKTGNKWSYSYQHPLLGDGPIFGNLIQEEDSADPELHPRRAVAQSVFKDFAGRTVADVRSARDYGVPLGSAIRRTAPLAIINDTDPDEASVALALRLPRLEGVPVDDLIRIRRDESLSFDRFRVAIRSAIRERVASAGAASSEAIARDIQKDIIEPALLEIEGKLLAARRVLRRKTGASILLTSFATAVGLAANIPLLLPAGVAMGLATATSTYFGKYQEEVRDIELDKLYFLWRLGDYQH